MNIAVIGGGFAGLTAAYELGKKGHRIFLFERMNELGGLAGTFEIEGTRLERGYHHWFTSDTDIISLMNELGLGDWLMWLPSKVGLFENNQIWDMVTPMDLMRFEPMPLIDRFRFGLVLYYLTFLQAKRERLSHYEKIAAAPWLKKYAGQHAWDQWLGPMFYGKFGKEADTIPLVWFWYKAVLRVGSRKGLSKEVLGYPRGSFQVLINGLEQRILGLGGKIFRGATVQRVVVQDGVATGLQFEGAVPGLETDAAGIANFDRIICTAPSFATLQIVKDFPEAYIAKIKAARYMAAVLVILKMKKSMSPIYWLNIADRSIPFVATIEQTNFLPPETYNNKRILYISNYLDASSPYFKMNRYELINAYLPHLKKLNPQFTPDWVEDFWHFKEAAAQPIFPLGYSKLIPEYRTPLRNLYLANTTQIYPEDRGTNYSVRLGRIVAKMVQDDMVGGGWG